MKPHEAVLARLVHRFRAFQGGRFYYFPQLRKELPLVGIRARALILAPALARKAHRALQLRLDDGLAAFALQLQRVVIDLRGGDVLRQPRPFRHAKVFTADNHGIRHPALRPFQHPRLPEGVAHVHGPGGGDVVQGGVRGGGERAPVARRQGSPQGVVVRVARGRGEHAAEDLPHGRGNVQPGVVHLAVNIEEPLPQAFEHAAQFCRGGSAFQQKAFSGTGEFLLHVPRPGLARFHPHKGLDALPVVHKITRRIGAHGAFRHLAPKDVIQLMRRAGGVRRAEKLDDRPPVLPRVEEEAGAGPVGGLIHVRECFF